MIFLVLLFISFCIQRIIDEVFEPSSLTLELLLDSSFRKNPNLERLSLSDSLKMRYFENIGVNFEEININNMNSSSQNSTEKLIKSSIMIGSKNYLFMEKGIDEFLYLFNIYDGGKFSQRRYFHSLHSCNL